MQEMLPNESFWDKMQFLFNAYAPVSGLSTSSLINEGESLLTLLRLHSTVALVDE